MASMLIIIGCKKEGCTISSAINYDSEADVNNGSCMYQTKVSFWFNQNISNAWITQGVTILNIYFDDVQVGSMDPADWKPGPDCDGNNYTITYDLGLVDTKTVFCVVRNQSGNNKFSTEITLYNGSCHNIEI